ncbi:immunoglobulin lambda-1 light chain-like isoform X3 [Lepisosteus oculatus]|uniref:immunoglobulin lambda-1 light chain-like isoform X3 n=1 Tax=Lepisosteus oculatus TaxID=7918 RepID=UPI0037115E67
MLTFPFTDMRAAKPLSVPSKRASTAKMLGLLLLFSGIQKGAASSVVVQYPRSLKAQAGAGATVNLTCTINDAMAHCNSTAWVRVALSGAMRMDLYANSSKNHDDIGFSKTQRKCLLTINNLQAKDSGVYYCVYMYSKTPYFGNSSRVEVIEPPKTSPSIEILHPTSDAVQFAGAVSLLCLVRGVSLLEGRVFWRISGKEETGVTDSGGSDPRKSGQDFIRNQLFIPAHTWASGVPCTCVVQTDSGLDMSKTVSLGADPLACSSLFYGIGAAASISIMALLFLLVYKVRSSSGRRENTPVRSGNTSHPKPRDMVREDVQYAALKFEHRKQRQRQEETLT